MTWTAQASGGVAPLEYQFVRMDPDGWKIVQPYGASYTYTWTPALADAGTHVVQVWVRNAGSAGLYDAWLGTGLFQVHQRIGRRAVSAAPYGRIRTPSDARLFVLFRSKHVGAVAAKNQ